MTIIAALSNLGSMNTSNIQKQSSHAIVQSNNNISVQGSAQNAGLLDLDILASILGLIGIRIKANVL
ncbi:hypothetical protein DLAC_10167 [Tieghemostelium lacteum]|uniref:Uncharacterized protein n=1 Tax=Tieghemostelium lacteum TaxID=361077 RepID=A0A151Z6B2_TIELA|nr:hypothetical protein DLAC_10167 [Tieghemostelium lacteum]|eukprot:KYQ89492.1 hypothetical protein DLAC_10167 [Tieghemostelium lacteum]